MPSRGLPWGVALVALGSNLGDSTLLIRQALLRLATLEPIGFRASSLWASDPVDCPPGSPPFVNAMAWLHVGSRHTPEAMLAILQGWEREFGRRPRQVLNEPRPLDLDLIGFGDATSTAPDLILPHPRAHLRRFVLEPLCEIVPDLRLPGWPANATDLLAGLPPGQKVRRIEHP